MLWVKNGLYASRTLYPNVFGLVGWSDSTKICNIRTNLIPLPAEVVYTFKKSCIYLSTLGIGTLSKFNYI
jgi:hypothetical protein